MNISKAKKGRGRVPVVSPEFQQLFDELCEVLHRLGVEVRIEAGYFKGGLCMLEDRPVFFINKNQLVDQNVDLITDYLSTRDISHLFISPKIREKIENRESNIEANL